MDGPPRLPVSAEELNAAIGQGASAMGLRLSALQLQQLSDFLALLQKWNKVYNLTAVRDPLAMLQLHVLDSMAAVLPLQRYLEQGPQREAPRVLDVGSGGGLPGVVFAICLPQLHVDCVDTVGKKAAFIQQVAATLRLPQLRGVHARVESVAGPYDVICSRAFASLADFTQWSSAALGESAVWLAMKGKRPDDEIAALPPPVHMFHVEQLTVPGLDAERCIVWMKRAQPAL